MSVRAERLTTPARTGVWVGIAAIVLMVAALTGALMVRRTAADWMHVRLPSIIYVNTLVLLASSVTLERARAGLAAGTRWLTITLALGLLFVVGQVAAWLNLAAQGLFLATSPASAFFYVLTALHGVHLLGGVGALGYVRSQVHRSQGVAGALDAAALYWQFLAVLWLYLLLLLTVQL